MCIHCVYVYTLDVYIECIHCVYTLFVRVSRVSAQTLFSCSFLFFLKIALVDPTRYILMCISICALGNYAEVKIAEISIRSYKKPQPDLFL